jgi:phosphocarrier protein HPr
MTSSAALKSTVTVCNIRGLHARAAAKFVKTAASFKANIHVTRGDDGDSADEPVSGSSILGLMMLAADKGSQLHIVTSGDQAKEALDALTHLVENRFGEDE